MVRTVLSTRSPAIVVPLALTLIALVLMPVTAQHDATPPQTASFSTFAHLSAVYGHDETLDVAPLSFTAAIQALDDRLGVHRLPGELDAGIHLLDGDLVAPLETLLSAVVAAHDARDAAYHDMTDAQIIAHLDTERNHDAARLAATVDTHLLQRAALALAAATDTALPALQAYARDHAPPSLAAGLPPAIDLAPVVVVDPDSADNRHLSDAVLVVDLGGDDVYETNAGGAMIHAGLVGAPESCQLYALGAGIDCDNEDALASFSAALLIDLEGNDTYGVYEAPRAGSSDATCTSDPIIRRVVVQGSGSGGIGMLVDVAGSDAYRGKTLAQGNGHLGGVGALFDLDGDDTYDAIRSAMGSSVLGGTGSLYDGAGADRYTFAAPTGGLFNVDQFRCDVTARLGLGAAVVAGTGHFLDAAGDDVYRIDAQGLGHAGPPDAAWFIDSAGLDDYGGYPERGNDVTVTGPGLFVDTQR